MDWRIIGLSNRVDYFNQNQIQKAIRAHMDKGHYYIAIDLGLTQFLSVPMIQFLTEEGQKLEKMGGKMALLRPSERLLRHLVAYGKVESFLIVRNFEMLQILGTSQSSEAISEKLGYDVIFHS